MKRILLATAVIAATTIQLWSTESLTNDTVANIQNAHNVIITESKNGVSVEVQGKGDDEAFNYTYSNEYSPDTTIKTRQNSSEWNLNFPFMDNNGKEKTFKPRWNLFTSGLGIGFVNGVGAPPSMDFSMGSSIEIMWTNIIGLGYQPTKRGPQYSIGFGIDWKNYCMTGHSRFIKENGNITIGGYPEGADIKYSRIKIFSLSVPFMVQQKINKFFSVSGGVLLNINTYGSMKTKYELNGVKSEDFNKNIHQKPVTCEFIATISIKSIGAYIKYSPCDVLEKAYGPKFKSLSTGFVIFM